MVGIIDSLLGLDIISILVGVGIGLVPSLGFLILRGTLFEYQEWRKRKQEKREWFNEVERTANGIEQAWYYSGTRPEEQDRERAVEEMDELTNKLKEYRRHQNTTDGMVAKMTDIINRWDDCRHLILSTHGKHYYEMRDVYFSEAAEGLHEELNQERQGRIRGFVSMVATMVRDGIERYRRWQYSHQSLSPSYEIYRELSNHLTDNQITAFDAGDSFLLVQQNDGREAIYYDQDEDKYIPFHIDFDQDGEIVVLDKLEGLTTTEALLVSQLQDSDTVQTTSYEDIVPNGQSIDEFENSDSS